MGVKNTNLVILSGKVSKPPIKVSDRSEYMKTTIMILDEDYGRETPVEFLMKHAGWMDSAKVGDMLIVSGSVTGRYNTNQSTGGTYYNQSIYARSVELIGALQSVPAEDYGEEGGEIPY